MYVPIIAFYRMKITNCRIVNDTSSDTSHHVHNYVFNDNHP